MSKPQENPHLETRPRSFSCNISYKDWVLLFFLRRNRVSQKKTRKERLLVLRKTMTQIKTCRFNFYSENCFFPEKQSKSKFEVL